jgi:oxepin-CoA hydrolase/3-oxo-5,6-dehydrosuberyl-CoA semialdehyde dehydrogenase
MTAQHMVEHLVQSVRVSNGKKQLQELRIPEEKVPVRYAFLWSDQPLPRYIGATNPEQPLPDLQYASIPEALAVLEQELVIFEAYFKEHPDQKFLHPSFGKLNYQDWIRFHEKHFTHHFTQFGLL